MRVSWYEESQDDIRPGDDWLSEWELAHLHTLKIAKRRADWLLGRWTAKRAVTDYLKLRSVANGLSTIEVRPDGDGAPEVSIGGVLGRVAISLTHRNGLAACVVGEPTLRFGCDLEVVEPRCDEFAGDYFTPEEQAALEATPAAQRCLAIALIWSAKESALKTLRVGLRVATQAVSVEFAGVPQLEQLTASVDVDTPLTLVDQTWNRLVVNHSGGRVLPGRWCSDGRIIRTLVAINS